MGVRGYLGRALAGIEPEDLARCRVPAVAPRVVWPLVTRAHTEERVALRKVLGTVTTDTERSEAHRRTRDRATVRLRAALRVHMQAASAGLTVPPRARGGRQPRLTAELPSALAWDPVAWAADPVGIARAHLAALAAAHQTFVAAAAQAVGTATAERVVDAHLGTRATALVGGSLRQLARVPPERWRALASELPRRRTRAERDALALLRSVTPALARAATGAADAVNDDLSDAYLPD